MFQDYGELKPGAQVSSKVYELELTSCLTTWTPSSTKTDSSKTTTDGSWCRRWRSLLSASGARWKTSIPGGTLHAGQEIRFKHAVAVGTLLSCVATLAQNSVRGDWRFLVVDCRVTGGDDSEVMTGKSTIMIPVGQGPQKAEG